MSDFVVQFGQTILGSGWEVFSIPVPGFPFSFGEMYLGIFFVVLSVFVIYRVFGFSGSSSSYRAGGGRTGKVSKERKHDQF